MGTVLIWRDCHEYSFLLFFLCVPRMVKVEIKPEAAREELVPKCHFFSFFWGGKLALDTFFFKKKLGTFESKFYNRLQVESVVDNSSLSHNF